MEHWSRMESFFENWSILEYIVEYIGAIIVEYIWSIVEYIWSIVEYIWSIVEYI